MDGGGALVMSSPPIRPRAPSRPPDGSALESGGGDALGDPALEEDEDDQHGQDEDHATPP